MINYDKNGNYIMVQTSDNTQMREDIYCRIKCSIDCELNSDYDVGNHTAYTEAAAWALFTCTNAYYDWTVDKGCFTGANLTPEHDLGPALAKILGGGW